MVSHWTYLEEMSIGHACYRALSVLFLISFGLIAELPFQMTSLLSPPPFHPLLL